jgi:hypothetical protein
MTSAASETSSTHPLPRASEAQEFDFSGKKHAECSLIDRLRNRCDYVMVVLTGPMGNEGGFKRTEISPFVNFSANP